MTKKINPIAYDNWLGSPYTDEDDDDLTDEEEQKRQDALEDAARDQADDMAWDAEIASRWENTAYLDYLNF